MTKPIEDIMKETVNMAKKVGGQVKGFMIPILEIFLTDTTPEE